MIAYTVVDVFTRKPYAGNPLAIIDAGDLTGAQMQVIARQLNLSETIFITAGAAADAYTVRIFTPAMELPFAGHPSIGAAAWLSRSTGTSGEPVSLTLEEGIGPVHCQAHWDGDVGQARLHAPQLPQSRPPSVDSAAVAAALDVPATALVGEVTCWDAGVPFHVARLADDAMLDSLAVPLIGTINLIVCGAPGPDMDVRVFPQAAGVVEDPATGSAAVALAGWIAEHATGLTDVRIGQGRALGRASTLRLALRYTGAQLHQVELGGSVVWSGSGRLEHAPAP